MNAYLIQQDGEIKVWIAETMQAALDDAWTDYARELNENNDHCGDDEERAIYESEILQSCSLVAKVGTVHQTAEERDLRHAIAEIDMGDED